MRRSLRFLSANSLIMTKSGNKEIISSPSRPHLSPNMICIRTYFIFSIWITNHGNSQLMKNLWIVINNTSFVCLCKAFKKHICNVLYSQLVHTFVGNQSFWIKVMPQPTCLPSLKPQMGHKRRFFATDVKQSLSKWIEVPRYQRQAVYTGTV